MRMCVRPTLISNHMENISFFFFRFDITDGPRYGRVERLRGNGRWSGTKRFYSRQLERDKVNGLIRCGKSMYLKSIFISLQGPLPPHQGESLQGLLSLHRLSGGGRGGRGGRGRPRRIHVPHKSKIFLSFSSIRQKKNVLSIFFRTSPCTSSTSAS